MGSPSQAVPDNGVCKEVGFISKTIEKEDDRTAFDDDTFHKVPDDNIILEGPHSDKEEEELEDVCVWTKEGNDDEEERISLGLIGKLWTDRTLNSNAFISIIKNVQVTKYGVDINMIGKNLY